MTNKSVKTLNEIITSHSLSYGIPHIFKTLQIIKQQHYVSRNYISKEIHLGDGPVRGLIVKLKQLGFANTSSRGTTLTSKGKFFLKSILDKIPQEYAFQDDKLLHGKHKHAILIKNHTQFFKTGIEQRDLAVKYGAKDVLTLCYIENTFSIGKKLIILKNHNTTKKLLQTNLMPENNDLIIITSSDDPFVAEMSAKYSALLTLN